MKRHKLHHIGLVLALTAATACLVIALLPEKSGIRIPVCCANGRMGYIDDTGRMVIKAEWKRATPFGQDGFSHVTSDDRSRKFDFRFKGGIPTFRTYVTRTEKHWKMDRLGNRFSCDVVQILQRSPEMRPTPPDSHSMSMTSWHRAISDRGFHWIRTDGSEAFPGRWEKAINFINEDPAAVFKDGAWGFINRRGETVIPFEWSQTTGFDGRGRACVSVNNRWGVINARGETVVPLYFRHLAGFDERNMCAAGLESGCGFIGPAGNIVIPFRHVRVEPFDGFDMAKVVMRDKDNQLRVGWIDRSGNPVVPCIYHDRVPEWASSWSRDHELLPVCDHKGFGLIDRKGRVVIPTGGGPLTHVEDPLAPGRFWITRVPDAPYSKPRTGAFKPACYDQTGKPIWQGSTRTRSQSATWLAGFFGVVSGVLLLPMRRQREDAC